MYTGSLEEVKAYASDYSVVPIYETLFADTITPISLLKKLKNASGNVYMLESVEQQKRWSRYTFLGFDPYLCISAVGDEVTINYCRDEGRVEVKKGNPIPILKEFLKEYTSPRIEGMPSFTGGLVGYFSYDFIKYSEPKLKLDAKDEEGFKDLDLMLFDNVIAFDNLQQKIYIIANVRTSNLEADYEAARADIAAIKDIIINGKEIEEAPAEILSEFTPLFNKEEYMSMVEAGKHYIFEGDIFQVVLSNRLEAKMTGSLLDTYRMLRTINPSPYMFYFAGTDVEVAGSSPETLVKLENGILHTFPLAGTRPRSTDEAEDKRREKELLADPKECAEHNMLVDLGRNDLGRISKFGTVEVEDYMSVLRYSHVMHIGSTVRGEIRDDLDAIDAVAAVLPAGTLSGAPKIRACEIINELENNKRGIYGGAIGYVDFTGNMDTCIGIRLCYKKNDKVFVRSGAGIVADSNPATEFEETINKAKAVVVSIENSKEVRA